MVFKNKLIALASVAGGLLLLVVLGWIFSPENNQKRAAAGTLVDERVLDRATAFSVNADGAVIEMAKQGNAWTFQKGGGAYPVAADRVNSFFKALASVKQLYKVSSKKETWKDFGLAEGARTLTVKDKNGTVIADIVVGNPDAMGKRVYMAFAGKDQVYLADNSFSSYLRSADSSWSDLRVFPAGLTEKDVQEIFVKADLPPVEGETAGFKTEYHLIRDAKKAWKAVGQDALVLDPNLVDTLVRGFIGLSGDSFITENAAVAKEGLKDAKASVIIRTGGGEEYSLRVSAKDTDDKHVMGLDGSPYLFQMSAYSVSYNWKDIAELLVKEQ